MKKILVLFLCFFTQQLNGLKHFVLIAAPGSGKGTFSQYVTQKYGYVQICPGDIYRHEIQQQTKLGKRIQPIVDKGEYVDEETTRLLISQHLLAALEQNKCFIIDGFPRTKGSFQFLHDVLAQHGLSGDVCFIQFVASDECCMSRVSERLICTKCFHVYNIKSALSLDGCTCDGCGTTLTRRKADTDDIMVKRLIFFHTHIEPLMKMAAELYDTKIINTECSIEKLLEVYDALVTQ